jgi:C4-dicarboxylate-binding protein DctP
MKRFISCIVALFLIVAFTSVDVWAAEVLKFKFTGHMPVGQICTVAAERFVKEVEKRSKGTIQITYYPAGQLAMDTKAMEMVQKGGVEMAQFFVNRAVGIIPETQLPIPYFDGPDWNMRRCFDPQSGGGLMQKYIIPAFAKNGMHYMLGFLYAPEHSTITAKKPVYKMADYKGLKIRVSGRELGVAVDSWGARATVMSSADVYMALSRGTIDGANSGITSMISRKWYEAANYVQLLETQPATLDIICNLKWWKSLTDEQRTIITESLREQSLWSFQQAIDEYKRNIKFLKSKGVQVFDLKRQAPTEHEKMRQATIKALEKELVPSVGQAAWDDNIRMLNATKNGKRTWKDVIKGLKY